MANNVPNFNPAALETESAAKAESFDNFAFSRIDTVMPVKVHSLIDGNNMFVNVIPVQTAETTGGEELTNGADDVIYNVPVMLLYGKNSRITFEVQAGDYGLLLAAKRDISAYKSEHSEAVPPTRRTFSFADGFFVPLDFQNVESGVIIQNNQTKITVGDGAVTIEANGTIAVNCTDATVTASGTVTATAGGDASITASGNATVSGTDVSVNASGSATVSGADVSVTSSGTANVEGQTVNVKGSAVNLGGESGQPVARLGDAVTVGGVQGTITAGSAIVKSA